MPAYNFTKRFSPAVESGDKTQTIRATDKKALPGQAAHLFTGQRTKACRRLGLGTLISVSPIEIGRHACGEPYAVLNPSSLRPTHLVHFDLDRFAKADGFQTGEEMVEWFAAQYVLPFNGFLHIWKMSNVDR